jgi:hypothetical protein
MDLSDLGPGPGCMNLAIKPRACEKRSMPRKKSAAQLDREIADALSRGRLPSRPLPSLPAARHARKKPAGKKKLVVEYDVTGLSKKEIDALTGAAEVQAEESDTYDIGHPDVAVKSRLRKGGKRKILVVEYDVAGLSEDQIDVLTGEAEAQADGGDGGLWIDGEPTSAVYPSVSYTSKVA